MHPGNLEGVILNSPVLLYHLLIVRSGLPLGVKSRLDRAKELHTDELSLNSNAHIVNSTENMSYTVEP